MVRQILTVLFLASAAAVGCGSSGEEGGSSKKGGSSDDPGADDPNGGIIFTGEPGTDGGAAIGDPGAGCVAETVATEAAPLDIYVMFDQSCSMSCEPERAGAGLCCIGGPRPRIDQVRGAMEQFLQNPESAGIGIGIGYFGYFQAGNTSCNPQDYARASVQIAPLPDNANAMIQSLRSVAPTGETPTGAAIRGACTYASAWKQANPGHQTVILLVTDGFPEAPVTERTGRCSPSMQDAQAAAAECLGGGQNIPTYVLGVGQNLDNLTAIAQSGGTGQAYLVGGSTDVSGAVLEALNSIRDSANIPCTFKVPPPPAGKQLNPALVNITYLDARGDTHIIPGLPASTNCTADGGWFYDNPANPVSLSLCQATCDRVTAGLIAGSVLGKPARLDIQYGCATVDVITR